MHLFFKNAYLVMECNHYHYHSSFILVLNEDGPILLFEKLPRAIIHILINIQKYAIL